MCLGVDRASDCNCLLVGTSVPTGGSPAHSHPGQGSWHKDVSSPHRSLPTAQPCSQRPGDNGMGSLPLVDCLDVSKLDVSCLWMTSLQKNRGFPLFQHSVLLWCLASSLPGFSVLKSLRISLAGEKRLYNPWAEAGSVKDKVARQVLRDHLLNVFWRKKRNEDGWKMCVSQWETAEGSRQQGGNYLEVFGADFLVCGEIVTRGACRRTLQLETEGHDPCVSRRSSSLTWALWGLLPWLLSSLLLWHGCCRWNAWTQEGFLSPWVERLWPAADLKMIG